MTDTAVDVPTQRWVRISSLAPLTGSEALAEALVLLLHYGIDWADGWVGRKVDDYWAKQLPSRIIARTYTCQGSLPRWWQETATDLEARPRNRAERHELEALLRAEPRPVLHTLRTETEFLVMRAQIIAAAVREAKGQR